jgi:eukaryotic-like serine/threonine-protein kinase
MELLVPKQSYTAEEELFAAALALPESERCKYLERACAGDAALSDRLRSLLEATEAAAGFMSEPGTVARDGIDAIGPYRLVKELGEGGCGVAYLAQQTAPVKREVALKVIKPGMDTRAVIARFEAERQAVALMDHPHVAKVFDAGATSAGRPYFVMELVRGIKITDYCNQSRLSVRERLTLFIQVCQAIQHAHLKGIIHRDIKPSNVLVTMHDGASIAKVIDFGIAKAMQGRLTDDTVHTALGQFIGTPAYISPEQTDPASAHVDTRSDIYSLGVLLYELLTGCTPIDVTDRSGLSRARELIRAEEPVTPSRRLGILDQDLTSRDRLSVPVIQHAREIQVDLDWIVMRCLEKERERRYQTVHDLVLDVQRYLSHEPVLARPPSLAYVLRKFARRHRTMGITGLAAGTALVSILALLAMSDRISIERAHAQQQEDRAHRMSSVTLNVVAATDPYENSGPELTPETVLEAAERSARAELHHQPRAQADLLEAIGKAYQRRGDVPKGLSVLEDALRLRRQVRDDIATLGTATELIRAVRATGNLQRTEQALTEAFAFAKHRGLEGSAAYAKLLRARGLARLAVADVSGSRQDLNEALILTQELFGRESYAVADLKHRLSSNFLWTDELHEAERLIRDAIAIYAVVLPPGHMDRVLAQRQLGDLLFVQTRLDEAATQFLEALQWLTRTMGENSSEVANTLDSLAQVRQAQGQFEEAEIFARRSVAAYEATLGARKAQTAYSRGVLGDILLRRSEFEAAEVELRLALDIYRTELPDDHQYVASSEHRLGEVLLATGRLTEAESVLTSAMNRWKRAGAPAWRAARSANALGEVLYRQGRRIDAQRYLAESARELEADPNTEPWAKQKAQERTAMYLETPKSRIAQTAADDN